MFPPQEVGQVGEWLGLHHEDAAFVGQWRDGAIHRWRLAVALWLDTALDEPQQLSAAHAPLLADLDSAQVTTVKHVRNRTAFELEHHSRLVRCEHQREVRPL